MCSLVNFLLNVCFLCMHECYCIYDDVMLWFKPIMTYILLWWGRLCYILLEPHVILFLCMFCGKLLAFEIM